MIRLYHSFPRPAESKGGLDRALATGLEALRTMIEFGIVLTPEPLNIPPNPRSTCEVTPRTEFPQQRACFTLMQREELFAPAPDRGKTAGRSHANRFGSFAIGLDPIRARILGAVPVIYFYGTSGVENISYEILYRIRELRTLMSCLSHIEAKAALPDHDILDCSKLCEFGFDLCDEPTIAERVAQATEPTARAVAELLDTDRVAAWNLVDWIDILLNLFQTADSKTVPDSLAYYQQREWRIVRLFGEHVQCYPLELAPSGATEGGRSGYPESECLELRARLKAVDHNFFSDERLDNSSVMLGTRAEPFFDFVEEVIVPVEAATAAETILLHYGLDNVFRESAVSSEWVSFERLQELEA